MKIKAHNSKLDVNQSTNNVKINTKLWIHLSHHICLTFKTLEHITVNGTGRSPFMLQQKGVDWSTGVKGL